MPCSKLYNLTELRANDVKFTSVDKQKLDLSKYFYPYGTVNSIFVEIQPNSTSIKMTLVLRRNQIPKHRDAIMANAST